mmetsp:Transcript_24905/g.38069  ORF Transcript_24905/g.38069 Transcript_24905/m.38069 type:complete len:243 (+) Transcript_24905:1-729(+)
MTSTSTSTSTGTSCETTFSSEPGCEKRCWPHLPIWAQAHARCHWGEKLMIGEWEGSQTNGNGDPEEVEYYRNTNGWKGNDLVHSVLSPVRILEYRVNYPADEGSGSGVGAGVGTTLHGIVHFTKNAESHKGYCHGGSMCSIMDDIIGWTGFCVTGSCQPWSGFTVQVNTSLMKPIQVGQVLKLECVIEKVERRKVHLKAKLVDPGLGNNDNDNGVEVCHARGEGLVIVNHGVLEDEKKSNHP